MSEENKNVVAKDKEAQEQPTQVLETVKDDKPANDTPMDKLAKMPERTYRILLVVLCVVVVAAIGTGIYLLAFGSGDHPSPSNTPTTSTITNDDGSGDDTASTSDKASAKKSSSKKDDVTDIPASDSNDDKPVTGTDGEVDSAADNDGDSKKSKSTKHTHDYVATYKTVHHKAQTHTVHHETTYKQETTQHTVCNTCGKEIDGKAVSHINKTGHSGYTKNVPVTKNVVDQKAYDEVVVDKKAYDETKLTGYKCVSCDKTLTVKQMKKLKEKEGSK